MKLKRNIVKMAALAAASALTLSACGMAVMSNTAGAEVNASTSISANSSTTEGASSSETEQGNIDPSEISWLMETNSDGAATLTGYDAGGKALYGEITLPSSVDGVPVTRIGKRCFYGNTQITAVNIPSSVEWIEKEAFQFCTGLKTVKAEKGLQQIGVHAFAGCTSLTNVSLPNTLKKISSLAFANCTSLEQFVIPEHRYKGDTEITVEQYAFDGCTSLKRIFVPQGVKKLNQPFTSGTEIEEIYYSGTEGQWSKIEIAEDSITTAACMYYNATLKDMLGSDYNDSADSEASAESSSASDSASSESTPASSTPSASSESSSESASSSSEAASSSSESSSSSSEAASSSESSSSSSEETKPTTSEMVNDFRKDVLFQINLYRAQNNKTLLEMDNANLTAAAQKRAQELETNFSKNRIDADGNENEGVWIVDEFDVSCEVASEIIAQKEAVSAESLVRYWMYEDINADTQILGSSFKTIGVGYHEGADGYIYCDVLFID